MKVNEFENKLKELEQPKAPEKVSIDVLQFAKEKLEENSVLEQINWFDITFINKILMMIAGSIPFVELFWFINEIFIKKNNIKIKLH